jgi:hypothetical protein
VDASAATPFRSDVRPEASAAATARDDVQLCDARGNDERLPRRSVMKCSLVRCRTVVAVCASQEYGDAGAGPKPAAETPRPVRLPGHGTLLMLN